MKRPRPRKRGGSRWLCLVLLAAFGFFAQAGLASTSSVQAAAPPPALLQGTVPNDAAADVLRRKDGRVSTLVRVNGQGPFPFIVDTGANRSSISQELARALELPPVSDRVVNGVTGAQVRSVALADTLTAGSLSARRLEMPIIEDVALGGSRGLLAANELKGERIVLDFTNERYEITKSGRGRLPSGVQKLQARLRFGHLVETPCRLGTIAARCIIDTGAEYTLLNGPMLKRLLGDRRSKIIAKDVELFGATQAVLKGTVVQLPPIQLGDTRFVGAAALGTDAHIFQVWGVSTTPAVLLGMNVLRACGYLAIDFPQKALFIRLEE